MLGQTFKNIKRLQEIGTVFANFGFSGILAEIGLDKIISSVPEQEAPSHSTAVRLRMAFEQLGVAFVKLGQMLSLRPDLIPREYIDEFKKLQDEVAPFPVEAVYDQVLDELESPVSEIFKDFDPKPIGAASIGQVHRATLQDGRQVVLKVQRPGVDQQVETDLSILFSVANLLDRYANIQVINPVAIVEEFAKSIRQELDYIHEAQNIETFTRNFEEYEDIVIPNVVWELSSKRVVTMTYLDGTALKNVEQLREQGTDLKQLANLGLKTFMKMVFKDGFFHGDIHGGNLLVLEGNRLGILDMGLAGRLDDRLLQEMASLFIALVMRDYKGLARTYLRLSTGGGEAISPEAFSRDLQSALEPIMELKLGKIDSAELMMNLAGIAQRHHIQVPQELLLLFRAIISLESIGRELDPDFDLLAATNDVAREIVIDRYAPDKLLMDLVVVLRDLADMGRDVPGQMSSILYRMEEGKIGVDVRMRDQNTLNALEAQGWRIASAIIAASGGIMLALANTSDRLVSLTGFFGLVMVGLGGSGFAYSLILKGLRRRR